MDEMDYKLYVLAEINYKKAHPEIKEDDLFPIDWYNSNNYKLKTEIIVESIKEKKLIEETSKYQDLIEGIRKSQ